LSATTPLASRPGAAPGRLSFGDSAAQAGARLVEIKRAGSVHAPGPRFGGANIG